MIFILFLTIANATNINFKTNNGKFLKKKGAESWEEFSRFAAINLGVTSPGYQPGQVILDYDDYTRRFQQLEIMGINVVRVYALASPGFYKALNDWNRNHDPIYVLHGTAFPEYEMEHNNGTSAYDEEITRLMKLYIDQSLVGVYGGGRYPYKYDYSNEPPKPIYGDYNTDISQYLLGWVISGEISPHCINRTNGDTMTLSPNGKYFHATQNASNFEIWVTHMFDHLAEQSITRYNSMAPISHTNWVTTDGLTGNREFEGQSNFSEIHAREPRMFGEMFGETDYTSVEDWQEFDLHNIRPTELWEAGMFYNQHAYPYYPDMVKTNENDPFKKYLQKIRTYYSDLPLIITEFGLPTSIGISSFERKFGRSHGGLEEIDQGDRMYEMMKMIMNETDMNGIAIFQMYDEWFKKSWNTKDYEINRQQWKNVLTSEQYFGMFSVDSNPDLKINQEETGNDFYNIKIHNNYEYVSLDIEMKRPIDSGAEIMIGIDMMPAGVKEWNGINFNNEIDAYILIKEDSVKFLMSSDYETYRKRYGQWLEPSIYNVEYFKDITFEPPKMLVKVPTKANWKDPDCNEKTSRIEGDKLFITNNTNNIQNADICHIVLDENNNYATYYEAQIFTIPFNEKMVNRGNKSMNINIPYQLLGYSDPSSHIKTFMSGLGKQFKVSHQEYKTPLNFEFTYIFGKEIKESKINMDFTWDKWSVPEFWLVKPKESINAFRMAFHEINYPYKTISNLTKEQLEAMTYYKTIPIVGIIANIHFYLVKVASFILLTVFLSASIGKIMFKHFSYCYSSKDVIIGSYKMVAYNFIVAIGIGFYIYKDIPSSFVVSNPIYYLYILLIGWESFILLLLVLFNKWDLYEENTETHNTREHAFVVACHNSSDVLPSTLKSLIEKVPGSQIYVADNGSTEKEQKMCKQICVELDMDIHYGHITFETTINGKTINRGNKTMAQYAAICHLDDEVKYVTCIDDDTRLHETWDVNKAIKYFKDDENVVVLAYPLTADDPQHEIEWFQAMEYLVSGFFKIFHSKVYSTIFNSGAFGTYRVDIVKEALLYHNTDYHGDDLQICMNIHQLKGKKIHDSDNKHKQNYKVATATNMVGTTIVPKCWLHLSSISRCFSDTCDCGNPDLFAQRSKGWFVSKHRFIPKYIKMIFNINGIQGLWVRLVALYELIMILNEYFAIFYVIFFLKNFGWWLFEGFIITYAFTVMVMIFFDFKVLQKNKQYIPFEFITMQPLIYKIFMITIYRYVGLFYNLFIYSFQHKSGTQINKRLKDEKFKDTIDGMFKEKDS